MNANAGCVCKTSIKQRSINNELRTINFFLAIFVCFNVISVRMIGHTNSHEYYLRYIPAERQQYFLGDAA